MQLSLICTTHFSRRNGLKMQNLSIDYEGLLLILQEKLRERKLISCDETLTLTPCHKIMVNNKIYTHFIITCLYSGEKFFLKISKGNDAAAHCNPYLMKMSNDVEKYNYPIILVPEFEFNGIHCFVLNFFKGESLDAISKVLSTKELQYISSKALDRIDELASIHADLYSVNGAFTKQNCIEILVEKMRKRIMHPVFKQYSFQNLINATQHCKIILNNSLFSKPTLIHMDVKPANIIYNTQTGFVSLIDFEHARFGDYDYGWTQVLLSGINAFDQEYKEIVVPYMTKGRLTLVDAIKIPKFKCYIFYQTACNLIYYYDHNLECPKDMTWLFQSLLNELSKE